MNIDQDWRRTARYTRLHRTSRSARSTTRHAHSVVPYIRTSLLTLAYIFILAVAYAAVWMLSAR